MSSGGQSEISKMPLRISCGGWGGQSGVKVQIHMLFHMSWTLSDPTRSHKSTSITVMGASVPHTTNGLHNEQIIVFGL